MAIARNIPAAGKKVSYWRVDLDQSTFNFTTRTATITLLGWRDSKSAGKDDPAISSCEFTVNGDNFDKFFTEKGNRKAQAYKAAHQFLMPFREAKKV